MIKLSTFAIGRRIVGDGGMPTTEFLRWINDCVKNIQTNVNDLGMLLTMIVAALKQAGIAIQTAEEAKAAVEAAAREPALINSYVVEQNVLSAAIDTANPTTAIITVANHTRMYGDNSFVSVTGGTIPGLALATQYFISYLDPERAGGTVLYETTTNPSLAGQSNNRHLVGGYTTPSTGGTGGGGGTTRPPGVPSWKFPEQEQPVVENQ